MKKRLLFSLLLSLFSFTLFAQNVTLDGIKYSLNRRTGEAKVSGYDQNLSGEVVIPETVSYSGTNYYVTSLANGCFSDCTSLTSVALPNSIMSLGDECFANCTSLTSVALPNSITSLGDECFTYCIRLTSVVLPNGVTSLGEGCFRGCRSLTSIPLPNSITSLPDGCFSGCTNLTSFDLPGSITSLGGSCFYGCSSLISIALPGSITSLGGSCFYGCSSLISIALPSSITSLGDKCFYNCSALSTVVCKWEAFDGTSISTVDPFSGIPSEAILYVPKGTAALYQNTDPWKSSFSNIVEYEGTPIQYVIIDGYIYRLENGEATLVKPVTSPAGEVVVPGTVTYSGTDYPVTSLNSGCFLGCDSLTSIALPDGITSLPNYCFNSCDSLTFIDLPSSIASLGDECFSYCTSLTSIVLPDGITSLPDRCFSDCYSLTSIVLPSSLTSLGGQCFASCHSLASIDLPSRIMSLETFCFVDCGALSSVKCNWESLEGVTTSDNPFYRISSEATLYVPKGTLALYQSTGPWKSSFKYIVEFDSDETAIDTPTHRGIVVSATAGYLTISGLNDGESISIYSISGSLLARSTAVAGTATYHGTSGDIVIVKIGEQSIKVQL